MTKRVEENPSTACNSMRRRNFIHHKSHMERSSACLIISVVTAGAVQSGGHALECLGRSCVAISTAVSSLRQKDRTLDRPGSGLAASAQRAGLTTHFMRPAARVSPWSLTRRRAFD
jgi:hypothetical protein